MATPVTGTFSGTGNSGVVTSGKCLFIIRFGGGAATVNVQAKVNDTWRTFIEDGVVTADADYIYDGPRVPLRLNCSAHTNNVDYEILPGE
jgi:hypothetical protein